MCLHTGRVDPYIYVIDGFVRFYVTVNRRPIHPIRNHPIRRGAKIKKRNHHVPCRMQRTTDNGRLNSGNHHHSSFWFSYHIYINCIYHHCCSAEYCNSDIDGCVLAGVVMATVFPLSHYRVDRLLQTESDAASTFIRKIMTRCD
jgi:hypothetical protein